MSEVEVSLDRQDRLVYVSARDPLAQPLFDELAYEYSSRYAAYIPEEELARELVRYPVEAFAPPHGAFLLLLREG